MRCRPGATRWRRRRWARRTFAPRSRRRLSVRDPGAIVLPASTSTGPVGIPSGFPHTPEGALAQLAAIDADVLTNASVDHARQVITAWAAPGGPNAESWTGVQAIAGFLSAANLSPAGPAGGSGLVVRATPLMGMVKATDGPDWAVVCVDFEVDATLKASGQVAVADCQRMAWDAAAAARPVAGRRRAPSRRRRRRSGPAPTPRSTPAGRTCAMASLLGLAHMQPSPRWPRGCQPALMPAFDPPGFTWETFFPLAWLAGRVGADVATNQWVQAMQSLWAGALWMVEFTFKLVDAFTTPDLSEGGPMAAIYPATFAIGGRWPWCWRSCRSGSPPGSAAVRAWPGSWSGSPSSVPPGPGCSASAPC